MGQVQLDGSPKELGFNMSFCPPKRGFNNQIQLIQLKTLKTLKGPEKCRKSPLKSGIQPNYWMRYPKNAPWLALKNHTTSTCGPVALRLLHAAMKPAATAAKFPVVRSGEFYQQKILITWRYNGNIMGYVCMYIYIQIHAQMK